jgi:hypothetical protein
MKTSKVPALKKSKCEQDTSDKMIYLAIDHCHRRGKYGMNSE